MPYKYRIRCSVIVLGMFGYRLLLPLTLDDPLQAEDRLPCGRNL